MTLIFIMILLLLYRLYPEYEIYILLSGLLLISLNKIEGLQIDMSNSDSSFSDYIYMPGGIDSTDDDIKLIKVSDDPVRNCYYKHRYSSPSPYIAFPSDPNNFNTEPNDYFASPRGPLFFDFINLVGERINGSDGGIYNYYNVNENDNTGYVAITGNLIDSLSPIHINQLGYKESIKYNSAIASPPYPPGFCGDTDTDTTCNNKALSYHSIFERPRRSRIIQHNYKDENINTLGVYKGWANSARGTLKLSNTEEIHFDDFLNKINSAENVMDREYFKTLNRKTLPSPNRRWFYDLIRLYVQANGSTSYFLNQLQESDEDWIDPEFYASWRDIWNDSEEWASPRPPDLKLPGSPGASPPYDSDIIVQDNRTIEYSRLQLKNSEVIDLYDYITRYNVDSGGHIKLDENASPPAIPHKDKRFIYEMIRLTGADGSSRSQRGWIREIIKKIMYIQDIKFLNSWNGAWPFTEEGYNDGEIEGIYFNDNDGYHRINQYIYHLDDTKKKTCVNEKNKVIDYVSNGSPCPLGSKEAPLNFKRGLYVECS